VERCHFGEPCPVTGESVAARRSAAASARHPRISAEAMAERKHDPVMNCKRVFKRAVTRMPMAIMEGARGMHVWTSSPGVDREADGRDQARYRESAPVRVTLFANRDVPIELEAIEQALALVPVRQTIEELRAAQLRGAIGAVMGRWRGGAGAATGGTR
jgi:hypothetical protein